MSLGSAHGQSAIDSGSRLFSVIRVNHESGLHGLRGAAEAGKYQDSGIGGLGSYELLGDEVHTVPQRGYETDVGLPVEVGQILLGKGALQGDDGHPMSLSELAVDLADEQVVSLAFTGILGDVNPARRRDLDERYATDELRVVVQEPLDSLHPVDYPLRVVKSVHSEK